MFLLYEYDIFWTFLIISSLIPILAFFISGILAPIRKGPEKLSSYESGIEPMGDAWLQFRIRYYMFALVFVVFDVETIFLYPWAMSFDVLGVSDLVHPTRTRHGHPAFLCSINLYVTIESEDIRHNVNIPPQSFLLVQNDQYVESEQVIAEIRTNIKWKGTHSAIVASIGFLIIWICYFGVNLLGIGLHSYGSFTFN
ncbi:hypothetical protein CASFOL_007746 [Castilleja foliolosa]|uniref:NADH-ubiquinone oxidoreductase chain 3 n=1 Tax=Castilleja foliolosa TaxID=1961234 RepID=A0ABD3E3J3_9LAMI